MFGYITINKAEMKFKDYDAYHAYYCGLCKTLKERYGKRGQMTLSFDMTFLLVLLSGLYEPETKLSSCHCIAHPFEKHPTLVNDFSGYVADMNLLLTYYKCKDDWADEKKRTRLAYARMLAPHMRKISAAYPEKTAVIAGLLDEISQNEAAKEQDIDKMAGLFGRVMAEIFAFRRDEWEQQMRSIGFYLGKFIYLMDAYEDIEEDEKNKNYNPLLALAHEPDFEERSRHILTMMMTECSKGFERLPILKYTDILRNILYSGVWYRYETVHQKRTAAQEKNDAGSI